MAAKRKNRRLEAVLDDEGDVRRSPRLRERYSRNRSAGGYPLSTVTYVATSRPSLSGYSRQREWEQQESILNESGQSVPSTFDLEQDDDASTGSGESGMVRETGYVSETAAQHYAATGETTDPQHLYGLDGSEEEEEDVLGSHRKYHVVEKTRVAVTPTKTPSEGTDGGGLGSSLLRGIVNLLFKLGSLLYLAATAILCLDVIILHRLYMVFSATTGWTDRPTAVTKPWLRFWILPVVLCALVVMLIGVPVAHEVPQYNISSADLAHLQSDMTVSLRATLSRDISEHLKKHMEEVNLQLDQQKKFQEGHTQQAVDEEKTAMLLKISALRAEMEALINQRVSEIWNKTNSSAITKAQMIQTVASQIQLHLDSAKEQWMKLVHEEVQHDVTRVAESVSELKKESQDKDKYYSEKFSSLETLIESYNTSTTEKLAQLISQLQAMTSSVSELQTGVEGHSKQLTSLEVEVRAVVVSLAEVRESVLQRIEELERVMDRKVEEEDVVRIFGEELNKTMESRDSILWSWLTGELGEMLEGQHFSASELTKKDVNELIQAALLRYSADRIAKFDFALENSGGFVVEDKCSKTFPLNTTHSLLGIPLWSIPSSSPKAIIQPQVNPGDCWALNGTSGHALIKLKLPVVITGVTLEHIPKELTPDGSLSSAPKDFRVWGKNDCNNATEGDVLDQFTYSIDGPPIQEFKVKEVEKAYSHAQFEFLSNHGNENYTCVYRVRVHGHPKAA